MTLGSETGTHFIAKGINLLKSKKKRRIKTCDERRKQASRRAER